MSNQTSSGTTKWLAICAIVLSVATTGYVLITGGRQGRGGGQRQSAMERVRETKKINVGYVVNVNQVDRDAQSGRLSGYHYEMMEHIVSEGGLSVAYEETTFSNMVTGLATNQYDVVIGGGYESVARAAETTFTDPLMYIPLGYVARADDARFRTEADLQTPGIRVAATAGGASADYVKLFLPKSEPVILARSELARIVLEVTSGRADVGVGNAANCLKFEREHPNVRYVTKGNPFFLFSSGFVIRQGEPDLLHFLNSAIRQFQANGLATRLEAKYNPDGQFWVPVKRP